MSANWPTEHMATVAVEAAAKALYEKGIPSASRNVAPAWGDLGPVDQLAYREATLPIVWSFLSTLPDPLNQVRSALRLLGEDEITPTGRRMLEKVLDA